MQLPPIVTLVLAVAWISTGSNAFGQAKDAQIRKALGSQSNLNFEEAPWGEIEEDLEIRYGINIVVPPSARDDSLTKNEPITFKCTAISLRNALRLMLFEKNATFTVQKGVLMIISKDDETDPRFMNRSLIDITNLLKLIAKHEGELNVPVGKAKPKEKKPEAATASSVLTEAVMSSFGNVWKETGKGGTASFKIVGNQAVIFSPEELKDDVTKLLKNLETAMSK